MIINFFASSITYLQYFLPIVIEAKKRNITSIFYLRNIAKKYGDVFEEENNKILMKCIKKHNIVIGDNDNILSGPIIVVDGDIYGPFKKDKNSLLHKIDRTKHKIYSLQENLNFLWIYDNYINLVDYCIFPNKVYAEYYNKISSKNLYIGNTRYDTINNLSDENINKLYTKYNLDKNDKHLLLLFPKQKYILEYNLNSSHILPLYSKFKQLGYKIIVKTRPKDDVFEDCKGDLFVSSDKYPNESIELMKICNLCVLFSSTAIEETIKMKIPCIDFCIDKTFEKRLNFLYDYSQIKKRFLIQQIKDWKDISVEILSNIINMLAIKNSEAFDNVIESYLFQGNISNKLLDIIETN